MRLRLLTVGRPKTGYVVEGLKDYARRLKAYGGCELVAVKAERASKGKPEERILAAEAANLTARLEEREVLWLLDRQGKGLSSRLWARELGRVRDLGTRSLALAVAGHLGAAPELVQRADLVLSLGPVTLPHELAALVGLEQLYRAASILAGSPYHR